MDHSGELTLQGRRGWNNKQDEDLDVHPHCPNSYLSASIHSELPVIIGSRLTFQYATRELLILQGVLDDPNGNGALQQPPAPQRKARHRGLSASAKRSRASDIALTMAQQRLKRAIDKLNNGGENNCSDDDEVIDLTQEDEEI